MAEESKSTAAFEKYCADPIVDAAITLAKGSLTKNLLMDCFMAGAQYAIGRCKEEHHEAEWTLIDELRQPEGATVTIICDNPDFNGQPNAAIEVSDDWTGWRDERFTGDTVLDALKAAKAARISRAPRLGAKSETEN